MHDKMSHYFYSEKSKMLKVNLNPIIFSHPEVDDSNLDGNVFYKQNLQILERINSLGGFKIDVSHLTPFYNLIFPQEVLINVNFVSSNQKSILCEVFDIDDNSALGLHAITAGDGFLAEENYLNSFEVFIFCPENEDYYDMVRKYAEQNYSFIEDGMSFYLSTLTHEVHHALIFLESSGGLTPKEVDIAYESGDFDNSTGDCSSGCNLPRIEHLFSYDLSQGQSPIEINERIVEHDGCESFKGLGFDIDDFITELEDVCHKSFYEVI